MSERTSGSATEVENALLGERPALRQALDDLEPASPTDLVERITSADAVGELERRGWRGLGNRDSFGWTACMGDRGLEPRTSALSERRSNRLS